MIYNMGDLKKKKKKKERKRIGPERGIESREESEDSREIEKIKK